MTGPDSGDVTDTLAAGSRRSHLFGAPSRRDGGGNGALIATASTLVVFLVLGFLVVNAPGWPEVQEQFLNVDEFTSSLPAILHAFILNVEIFLVAEALILPFALLLAVMRLLPGPVFFPFRLMSVVYTDLFRGLPGILVIYVLGYGAPALGLSWLPPNPLFWGTLSLVLVYSAYVAEVYRSGIESVHPSQEAAARSLGLSRSQSLRFVLLPQAVRRVIPQMLNDFIGLQKDTALVGLIGPVEAFRRSQIISDGDFNFTPYLVAAFLFLLLTVPLARFTDWLVKRDRKRYQAGAR